MTLQDLFDKTAEHPAAILIFFIMVPVTAFIVGAMTEEDERHQKPWTQLYSALIYMACIPGIFAGTMCLYQVVFGRGSLLDLNVLAYFLPMLAMFGTLFVIRQDVDLDRIPGFEKIPGLLMMMFATFLVILVIQKTHIWIYFRGSAIHLLVLFSILMLLFRFGLYKFMPAKRAGSVKSPEDREFEIW